MLPRHARDLDGRLTARSGRLALAINVWRRLDDIDDSALKEVEVVDLREGVGGRLLDCEVLARVRRRDDGQVATQRGLDVLVGQFRGSSRSFSSSTTSKSGG